MDREFPQQTAYHFAVQCQMVSPKSIHTSNIIKTKQVTFRNIYVYAFMHTITISEKEAMNLKENRELYMGGLGGRKLREIYCNYNINYSSSDCPKQSSLNYKIESSSSTDVSFPSPFSFIHSFIHSFMCVCV